MNVAPKAVTALAAMAAIGAVAVPAAGAHGRPQTRPTPHTHPTPQPRYDVPADACGNPLGSKVFKQFHDEHTYFLAPDGGFEAGADGWNLDGASVVDGNESFDLGGTGDSKSLSLPAGSSAVSPDVCVTRSHPLFRFVARRDAASAKRGQRGPKAKAPRLRVEVIYRNGKGHKKVRTAAKLRAGQAWRPTKKLAIAVGRATGRGKNATGNIAFRFTPIGAADWQIDDVFVDPHARR